MNSPLEKNFNTEEKELMKLYYKSNLCKSFIVFHEKFKILKRDINLTIATISSMFVY